MDQNYNGRPEERPSSESPARHKKKKKRSVGRIIAKTIGWIFLTVFTICVIGILTAGIFAKIFMTYVAGVGWHEKESKAETQVHRALKAACYDAHHAARQEINSGIAGMEVQGGFDARA